MMTTNKITESAIEKFAIELLEKQEYTYIYGPDIAPDSDTPERQSFEDVLLLERHQRAIRRINPDVPPDSCEDAIKQLLRISSPELITNNETFHRMLTEGIKVTYQKDGHHRGDLVWLIDFIKPDNNEFLVVNQFTVIENNINKRPDVILFVNGLPLVVIELKNAIDEKATVHSAFQQIKTYKEAIPRLFTFNGFVIISDGLEAKAGSISADFSRLMAWKSIDGKVEASPLVGQLETLIKGMLNKTVLLDLIRHFTVFEKSKKEDKVTGLSSIVTVKKIAAYHQYYAVNKAVESTLRAAGYLPTPCPSQEGNYEKGESQERNATPEKSLPREGGAKRREGSTLWETKRRILPYNPILKQRAKELRANMTLAEVLLWNHLKNGQIHGFDFDRQRPIDQYIVDFYCKDLMLAIEVDGSCHYSDEAKINDRIRQNRLESFGVRFLRFDNDDVEQNIEVVVRKISQWVDKHRNELVGRYPATAEPGFAPLLVPPAMYGVSGTESQPVGDRKGGVVWHTQGSGKSLSMVFYTGKIVLAMDNPTVVVITDRNDLDDQLYETFASARQLLRQEPIQAGNRGHLKELLKVASGGIVFTTIQKFFPEEGNVFEQLSERKNVVVIADEAHRTQYGFKAKTIDEKGVDGSVIGKKIVFGFAKYMRDGLPNATYLGFTGTPIESTDVNTPSVFGNYIDVYDISQAVEDGATVRIFYESRLAKIGLSEEGKKLVAQLDDDLDQDELTETQKAKAKWTQLEALIGSANRVKQVARDIVTHFEQRQIGSVNGKAMIVTMSRRIAAELYEEIIKIKPEWHNTDLKKGTIKVVMTTSSSDGPDVAKHYTTKDQRRALAERMKTPEDELKLVIVRDMWLTGFDVPCLNTLYIDKPMRGHNLMQAIARVNRVYKDKAGGLIVDYLGIAADLKKAISFYADAGGKGDPAETQEKAVQAMLEKLEIVSQMFHGFAYEEYFAADTGRKLSLILAAEEHILGLDDGKKRFINEVALLSQAFSIAIPHEQAMDVKEEVAFFQAVKARLAKFDSTGTGKTDEEIETAIRQVIDKALVTDKVIDVFDAAGIKKPDISILSEDFLLEVKNMEHKNIALEVLKKLLNDEIKTRIKKNLIQGKSLLEMLENSIKKYHNKILSAAEVIEELINLSKDITRMDEEPKEMGLSDYEYAFYTAIANNDSARQVMEKEQLRELAVVLYEKIRENTSIDWKIKESVRAKLKVIVKRTLRHYGYPPDMQMLATETVLKQAEMIADEITKDK
jgi:type I site-specific restriction-modification system R (restriction) subunit/very-short-patch-repair endonuclease